jgi:hypothetical protein
MAEDTSSISVLHPVPVGMRFWLLVITIVWLRREAVYKAENGDLAVWPLVGRIF